MPYLARVIHEAPSFGAWVDGRLAFVAENKGAPVIVGEYPTEAEALEAARSAALESASAIGFDAKYKRESAGDGESAKRKHMKGEAKKALMLSGVRRFKVGYMRDGRGHEGPWFYTEARARQARAILAAKHGKAAIWTD